MSSPVYQPINDFEKDDGQTSYADGHRDVPRSGESRFRTIMLAVGMFLCGVVSTLAVVALRSHLNPPAQCSMVFPEEKLIPPAAVQYEEVQFSTPVKFHPNGTEYLVMKPGETDYVLQASPEAHEAWRSLIWGRYFSVSEDEARSLWGEDFEQYKDPMRSGYTAGLDMFHQLHCLDQIRRAFHQDVYPPDAFHKEIHTAHCINQLRQAIMCWGSTAIVPLKPAAGAHGQYVSSDVVHTCRKFEPIRQFVSDRYNGTLHASRPSGFVEDGDGFY